MARIEPDRAALEIAYKRLGIAMPMTDALQHPTYKRLITARARKHMKQRLQFDPKKQQSNDND